MYFPVIKQVFPCIYTVYLFLIDCHIKFLLMTTQPSTGEDSEELWRNGTGASCWRALGIPSTGICVLHTQLTKVMFLQCSLQMMTEPAIGRPQGMDFKRFSLQLKKKEEKKKKKKNTKKESTFSLWLTRPATVIVFKRSVRGSLTLNANATRCNNLVSPEKGLFF